MEETVLVFDSGVKGKQGGIKGAKTPEQRKELANTIKRLIESAEQAKGSLPERWAANESLYNIEEYVPEFEPFEGAARFNLGLMRSKMDTLSASVITPIVTATPIFTASTSGQGALSTDEAQAVVDWELDRCGFTAKIRQASTIAANTGNAFLRFWWDVQAKGFLAYAPDVQSSERRTAEDETEEEPLDEFGQPIPPPPGKDIAFLGTRCDVIHPRDFVMTPVNVPIERARLVGNRVQLRRQEVSEYRLAEAWYCDTPSLVEAADQTAPGKSPEFARTEPTVSTEREDDMLDIYFLQVKFDLNKDGTEEWYQVIYAYESCEILDIAPYKWSRPEYVRVSYMSEPWSIYNSGSPAYSIQGVCKAHNAVFNQWYDGTNMSAFSTIFFDRRSGFTEHAFLKIEPGAAIGVDGIPDFKQVSVGFDGQYHANILQMLENQADAILRQNRMTSGQQLKAGSTATEAAKLAEGQTMNQNDYLLEFAGDHLCEAADLILEYCAYHYDQLVEVYQDSIPCTSKDQLEIRCNWEVTGKSPALMGPVISQRINEIVGALTTLNMGDRIKPEKVAAALVQYSGLPPGLDILMSDEEYAEQQMMLQQQMLQEQLGQINGQTEAGFGVPQDPGMGTGAGVLPPPF